MSAIGLTSVCAALIVVGLALGISGNRLRASSTRREAAPARAVTAARVSGWSLVVVSGLGLLGYFVAQFATAAGTHVHLIVIQVTAR